MALLSSAVDSVQSPSREEKGEHRIQPVLQLFPGLGTAMGVGQAGTVNTSIPPV